MTKGTGFALGLVALASLYAACGSDDAGGGKGGSGGSSGASGGSGTGAAGSGGASGAGASGASGGASGAGALSGSGGAIADASADTSVDAATDAPADVDLADGFVNLAACAVYVSAYTNKFKECTAGAAVAMGTQTQERVVERCALELAAPGTSATLNDLNACSATLQAQSCATFMAKPLSACVADPTSPFCTRIDPALLGCSPPAGTLTNGAACFAHLQCQSNYCKGDASGCGVCASRASVGGKCAQDADCNLGLACFKNGCVTPVAASQACIASGTPCAYGNSCSGGLCQPWRTLGQICGGAVGCDARRGLACSAGTCVNVKLVKAGSSCAAAPLVRCYDESDCSAGSCVAHNGDGTSCGAAGCMTFSSCRAGSCVRDNPGYCL
ncbi:MAG: hypothetical protein R3B13_13335 [Polyangiaceae bacterium]